MKKLALAVILCCTFSLHGIAANSNAKVNDIERLEKKINALKAERKNIENKFFENETKIPESSINESPSTSLKKILEKTENDIKMLKRGIALQKLEIDIYKINLNIDKANIELIRAEIKAGKTPKIPLEVAKSLVKRKKTFARVSEAVAKVKEAELKEEEANMRYLEGCVELNEKSDEIKNTNNSSFYIFITNIEIAELQVKRATLILKLEQARRETVQARINLARAGAEFSKIQHKFCKTYLKFNKVVDEKTFMSFCSNN